MFAKPYKLKSNNTLKNSEKKVLLQRIKDEFPKTSEEKIKELMPAKSTCFCMKLSLPSGHTVNVYSADGVPIMIETAEGLVPTVCALWKIPDLVPVLSIHTPVLAKMQKGAPLYLPGVVIPTRGVGFPMFPKGAIISLCTTDNMAAGVVGRAAMSSADMLLKAAGVCVDTIHIVGDQLCKDLKLNKVERPSLGPAPYGAGDVATHVSQLNIQPSEEWPSLVPPPSTHPPGSHSPSTTAVVDNEPRIIHDNDTQPDTPHEDIDETLLTENSQIEEDDVPTDMDGLLVWCLLTFMKVDSKSVELPLKTNLLYKNYLLPVCPPDRTLDVKKSSYKKLGKFLEAMQQEGLLEVRELDRGVAAVVALSRLHPRLAAHCGTLRRSAAHASPAAHTADAADYVPPRIRELYCVTAAVTPVLTEYKKGTALTAAEVRAAVTQYVTTRQLTARGGAVTLDDTLAPLVGKPAQESVKWDALMNGVLGKMTASTETQFSDGTVKLTKTKLQPVKMQVVNRSGNKKVTLVSNLESFGFNLSALAHVAQTGVAASCGVTRAPGATSDQLMLQGDQTHFVAKLLIEKYGLPKKFVEGADKALNKKK